MEYEHKPVLLGRVLDFLNPKLGGLYVDATLGGGGYAFALAKKAGKEGAVIAIDLDQLAINNGQERIKKEKNNNLILVHDNFKNLQAIIQERWPNAIGNVDGVVFDLGLSSAQLADQSRGFSFQLDAPLDMAFGKPERDVNKLASTEYIINNWKRERLADIISVYGEEKHANMIAVAITNERAEKPITSTKELVAIIESAIPLNEQRKSKIHPATKTFQALRIATNKELDSLDKVLPQAISVLKSGGRIAVVSYHSLEDRIVKQFFRDEARQCQCPPEIPICRCNHEPSIRILTKHIIVPTTEEIAENPRARSAKLRVVEKI